MGLLLVLPLTAFVELIADLHPSLMPAYPLSRR
jgi:hypothetical protein